MTNLGGFSPPAHSSTPFPPMVCRPRARTFTVLVDPSGAIGHRFAECEGLRGVSRHVVHGQRRPAKGLLPDAAPETVLAMKS